MRIIEGKIIKEQLVDKLLELGTHVDKDVEACLSEYVSVCDAELEHTVLSQIVHNNILAAQKGIPACQDTGTVVVFVELGDEVFINGNINEIVNSAVAEAYQRGYFRKSIVINPFNRVNSSDNTPAIIHYRIVQGNSLRIELALKGAGSENMSQIKMMLPTATKEDIYDYVLQVVKEAGGKACPPYIVGVGIGGDFEMAAILAKHALFRKFNDVTENFVMEEELLQRINGLGIGAMGLGGQLTALKVKINTYPTHIASMPVAVNLCCHCSRIGVIEL